MVDPGPTEGEAAPSPLRIWARASEEGEHRLKRSSVQLVATGLLGGFDVTFGVFAMLLVGGALSPIVGGELATLVGAIAFGLGLVFISIGRSELFTENFLVPMVAIVRHKGTWPGLLRLWALTFIGNAFGVVLIAYVLRLSGLVDHPDRRRFAVDRAEHLHAMQHLELFAAAVLAGVVMTLFTWLLHATRDDTARIALAIAVGFMLTAPPLAHVVVGLAELLIAVPAGADISLRAAVVTMVLTVLGNLVGGLGFVTLARSAQVLSWPAHPDKDDQKRRGQ